MPRLTLIRPRRIKEQRGQALVEFVLIAPVFLLLVFGTIDFARAFNYWIQQTHVANVGARYAAVNRNPGETLPTPQTLQAWLKDQATTKELKEGSTQVTAPGMEVCIRFPKPTWNPGDPVEVQARAEYRWLRVLGIADVRTEIVGRATMRLEAVPTKYQTADNPLSCS